MKTILQTPVMIEAKIAGLPPPWGCKRNNAGYMQDHPARSVGFGYSQDNANQ